ncbi:glycosyltransferase family 4 protein [Gynuella sunshinyii]|uniref:Glycosyltransferase n=1 Tax=Gynuella sunshinyii YC6258 TaxID=1445510 RepID=A0A0C5VY45_9GAMM|nr:glycosyltransferase family 4 protein [Gynuella sunshinyii]AJQ95284.1 glycosyltransferase [Gynuella sunshinyii YC6258]
MKVLYVDSCPDVAGGQRSLIALLSRFDNSIDYVLLISRFNKVFRNELVANGVDFQRVKIVPFPFLKNGLINGLVLIFSILYWSYVSKSKIVHCNTFFDGLFGGFSARLFGKKVIFRARCGIEMSNHGFLDKFIYFFSNKVLANSFYVMQTFQRIDSGLKKVEVVYNPLDLKFQRTVVAFKNPSPFLIGVVGTITEVKNQLELLKAVKILSDRKVDLTVKFIGAPRSSAGDISYLNLLKDYILTNDLSRRVVFTGFVSDVRSEMKDLGAVCVPSDREPLGRTIFESQLYGLPVICSDSGGNCELVKHGETGYVYKLGDITDLADKILECMEAGDRNFEIIQASKDQLANTFSPQQTIEKELAIYSKIVSGEY